ncbi:MAG: ribbon-helix-helix domain-containing protein [Nitrospira sp.]|nr:ribbon-helix-helix domain-containing protein [Nitrospira sp.]
MKSIIIRLPDDLKAKLDALRRQGYTINGFIRAAVEQALTQQHPAAGQRGTKR